MKRLFKLIDGDTVFGEIEVVSSPDGDDTNNEILIKNPWTAKDGNMMPYMLDVIAEAVGAIQIHPMNILWSAPLEDFKQAHDLWTEKVTGIQLDTKQSKIII